MLNDAVGFEKIFIATGLSSRYFYPHLFHDALILASFSIEIYKDNLNFQPEIALNASQAGNLHVIGTLNLYFSHTLHDRAE